MRHYYTFDVEAIGSKGIMSFSAVVAAVVIPVTDALVRGGLAVALLFREAHGRWKVTCTMGKILITH